MKVDKVSLPLLAALSLLGNSPALAGSASALDPYAYIQAPTRQEREQQAQKRQKKVKVRKLETAKEKAPENDSVARVPMKPATVILTENSNKSEDKKPSRESSVKTASRDDAGFLDGIKQSTDGLAKSARAAGSGMVNGTKTVGSKLAHGFIAAGEKVKDSTVSAGGKVKESGAGVGGKVANGFKAAGSSLAVLPKAVGGAAGKVGSSTGEGAKKIAAAPAAGFGAIGHGISKMNPFHKESQAAAENTKNIAKSVESKDSKNESQDALEKSAAEIASAEEKAAQMSQKAAKESIKNSEKIAAKDGGAKKKLALSPMAGIGATKASVGALSHGIGKLNPFHKNAKDNAQELTAKKTAEQKPLVENSAGSEPNQLGERIDPETETAAGPGAVPQ
ncbi:MAG: hypothetical protein K2X27_16485 [Candidatus Obscuribacterales bacterium]|nr:hypothetical protein [Candidatus Obscuribacterales bacterium]